MNETATEISNVRVSMIVNGASEMAVATRAKAFWKKFEIVITP